MFTGDSCSLYLNLSVPLFSGPHLCILFTVISQETSQLFAGVQIPYVKAFAGPKQRIKKNQDELCLAFSLCGHWYQSMVCSILFLPTLRETFLWLWSLGHFFFLPEPSKTITRFHWSHPQVLIGSLDVIVADNILRCYQRLSFLNFYFLTLFI